MNSPGAPVVVPHLHVRDIVIAVPAKLDRNRTTLATTKYVQAL
jgi:hypothetical protein